MLHGWRQTLFLLALGCSASMSQLPKPHPGLKALMFYTCVTKEVKNQCEESFTLDQNESANMGFTANFTTISQGYEAGIRSLFAVHDIFFNNSNHSLNANWRATWEDTKSKLTPYIMGNQVAGFFIGDELFPGKIPLGDFLTVLKVVDEFRDQFPHKALIIWENEGGTNWVSYVNKELGGKLPEELDIFSIDDYSMDVNQHKQFHENTIYPMLSPHQKVFLVPGSYATRAPQNISKSICKFMRNASYNTILMPSANLY